MRILILGASGLIGHKLFWDLSARFGDVYGVLHRDRREFSAYRLFESERVIDNVDVREFEKLTGIFEALRPDAILNCVGITKRRPAIRDMVQAIAVNALLPHRLAAWAGESGVRVVHFSTDCVFDGRAGDYTEESPTTAPDTYGRTKALGEIRYDHTLTIRSSFIGRELSEFSELLEWLLAQRGKTIKGFTQAWYSGVSTTVMTRVVGDILERFPQLSGLYQLALPRPISKYDLLCLAREAFQVDVHIEPDPSFETRPTLDGSKLRTKMKLELPSWREMMAELAQDARYDAPLAAAR
jgi:dTDP-4-dehydrorhamnose reductase